MGVDLRDLHVSNKTLNMGGAGERKWLLEKLVNHFAPDVYVTEVTRRVGQESQILFMFRDAYVSFPTKEGTFTPSDVNGFDADTLRDTFMDYAGSHINLINRLLVLKLSGSIGIEVPLGALIGFPELYVEMLQQLRENGVTVTFFVLMHDSDDISDVTDTFGIVVKQLVAEGAQFVLDNIQDARDLEMASNFFDIVSEFRLDTKNPGGPLVIEELVDTASKFNITAVIDGEH